VRQERDARCVKVAGCALRPQACACDDLVHRNLLLRLSGGKFNIDKLFGNYPTDRGRSSELLDAITPNAILNHVFYRNP
jgi:hypothetical protein